MENIAENVALFRRSQGGNPAVVFQEVYFWLPFERAKDEIGDFLYVSLVENGLESTHDLAQYYEPLVDSNVEKVISLVEENCLALKQGCKYQRKIDSLV